MSRNTGTVVVQAPNGVNQGSVTSGCRGITEAVAPFGTSKFEREGVNTSHIFLTFSPGINNDIWAFYF